MPALAVIIALLALPPSPSRGAEDLRVAAVALFKDKAVLDIAGKRRTLRIGDTSPEGVKLIAASSDLAEVELAGQRAQLRLDGKILGHFGRGIEAKSVQLYPNPDGHFYVDGQINGQLISFVVDTGATTVVLNKNQAQSIHLSYLIDGRPGMIETASGHAQAYFLKLDRVQIRTLVLTQVDAIVVDGDFPSRALLGQSFLNRLDMQRTGVVLELRER